MAAGTEERTTGGAEAADAHTPIYARIQAHIRGGIASGGFRPGERLPSETQLAAQFGTTRSTVVHALQKLVFDGVVVRRAGSGTYVSEATPHAEAASASGSLASEAGIGLGAVEYRLLFFAPLAGAGRHGASLPAEGDVDDLVVERLALENGQPVALEVARFPCAIGQRVTPAMLRQHRTPDILAALDLPLLRLEGTIRCANATRRTAKLLQIAPSTPVLVRDYQILDRAERPQARAVVWHRPGYRLFYGIDGR